MRNSVGDTIVKLLEEGKSSSEIVSMGHKKGTVYGTQRKWRQGRTQHPTNGGDKSLSSAANHDSQSIDASSDIESDPEILRLKKEIRKAELEKQLGILKVPLDTEIVVSAAQELGQRRQEECSWKKNEVCDLWGWSTAEEIPEEIGEPVPDGADWWRIKPSPIYCAMCLVDLKDDVEGLDADLQSMLLHGINRRFACQCGAKGMVAVAIKCTKCGKGAWWGWCPKPD